MPSVSVILAVYNAEGRIADCIYSVLCQTYMDFEFFIVDDGSNDGTREIVREWEGDPRIRFLHNPSNRGAAESRNRAIEEAQGRFLAFIDSDDWWSEEKLERQLAFMEENRCTVSCTGYERFVGGEVERVIYPPSHISYRKMLSSNFIGFSTSVLDTELSGKRYFRPLRFKEDYIYWLDILRHGFEAMGMKEVLCSYTADKSFTKKGTLAPRQWWVFREIEGMGVLQSLYYFGRYAVNGVKKNYL